MKFQVLALHQSESWRANGWKISFVISSWWKFDPFKLVSYQILGSTDVDLYIFWLSYMNNRYFLPESHQYILKAQEAIVHNLEMHVLLENS